MNKKTILITGATGFLGGYITRELFEADFRLILLVRKKAEVKATERLLEIFPAGNPSESVFNTRLDRIEIIEGDISTNRLGIDTDEYVRLAETVDEVFHCAAATKFINDTSDTLTRTNVLGAEHIALFCIVGKQKRLHYISTAYVAGKRRNKVFENELENDQLFNNNYERSKYDAERAISTYAKRYQIPCTIYRPSIIVGDMKTGYTKNYDNIYVFGKGLIRLKNHEMRMDPQAREIDNWNAVNPFQYLRFPGDKYGTINLVPIDYASRAIVAISQNANSINNTFHIVNPLAPTLGELAEWLKVATGVHRLKIASLHEFQVYPYTIEEKLFLQGTGAFQPYLFGEPYFDSTNTRSLLSSTGIECPMITQEMVSRFIQYAIDTNWGKIKKKQRLYASTDAILKF